MVRPKNILKSPIIVETDQKSHGVPSVVLSNLEIRYNKAQTALGPVSISVERGVHLSIVGPSGSGKTSLIRAIAGQIKPNKGSVFADGRVATIHQDLKLVSQHTAFTNVLHGAMGRHSILETAFTFPNDEKKRAILLLEQVGLSHRAHTPIRLLSGGEKQRVALARALMQEPDILLADEPVSSLDDFNAHAVMRLLGEITKAKGITLISVLHDKALARAYSDRMLCLEDGMVVCDCASEVFPHPTDGCGNTAECRRPFLGAKDAEEKARQEAVRVSKRNITAAVIGLSILFFVVSIIGLNIDRSSLEGASSGLLGFISGLIPRSQDEFAMIPWDVLSKGLIETLQMAFVGTGLGIVIAWPLSAITARNSSSLLLGRPVRFLLNAIRTVPSLVWALLFVSAVGLGPLAGVLSLTAYSVGYLTKFFYEAFEAVEPGPPSALKEIGASPLQRFLHAVWPAAKPAVLSSCFFMLEYNVRAASVLGIVDAGGIGFYIKQYIDYRFFPAVTASLLMVLAVVLLLDKISSVIRRRLVNYTT